MISVEDTGQGIPTEEQANIFQKFKTASGVIGRRQGTGLGLAYCKLVLEAHGGDIWVESQVGLGSTFKLSLPAVAL
jgi:signal transduction histidine kinase